MVRLEHVNKYFNRRKKNEIHVINDTTLQMENKGSGGAYQLALADAGKPRC